jgi:hypothetical protein
MFEWIPNQRGFCRDRWRGGRLSGTRRRHLDQPVAGTELARAPGERSPGPSPSPSKWKMRVIRWRRIEQAEFNLRSWLGKRFLPMQPGRVSQGGLLVDAAAENGTAGKWTVACRHG